MWKYPPQQSAKADISEFPTSSIHPPNARHVPPRLCLEVSSARRSPPSRRISHGGSGEAGEDDRRYIEV
ncbi:hypothetical protein VUR80DRAFT_823 [Thermomyces stellatus]